MVGKFLVESFNLRVSGHLRDVKLNLLNVLSKPGDDTPEYPTLGILLSKSSVLGKQNVTRRNTIRDTGH